MNLAHTLTQAAFKWPHKTALVFEGRRWTYLQWNRLVNKTAHAFRAAGIAKAGGVGGKKEANLAPTGYERLRLNTGARWRGAGVRRRRIGR